jgi:hypothetical protein
MHLLVLDACTIRKELSQHREFTHSFVLLPCLSPQLSYPVCRMVCLSFYFLAVQVKNKMQVHASEYGFGTHGKLDRHFAGFQLHGCTLITNAVPI